MVKVTIKRLRAGLTGATGLVLVGQGAGCASPVEGAAPEPVARTTSADTTAPVAGSLSMFSSSGSNVSGAAVWTFNVQGPVDEFVRVGDAMTMVVPAPELWPLLYPNEPMPDAQRLAMLQATYTIQAVSSGDVVDTVIATISSWDVNDDVMGTSAPFTVPAGTDTLTFELTIVDTDNGQSVELSTLDFMTVPVFGGQYPLRHVLFDNDGSTLRERVIENAALVAGGTAELSVSDWRADEIVQRTLLDTEIGTNTVYESRFGPSTMPIYGQVQYVVSVGYSFDGSSFYEQTLTADASPAVLDDLPGRTAYETTLGVPGDSTQLDVYLHVQAYLVADYTPWGNDAGIDKWYAQGQRVLIADKYDNPNGVAFTNYVIPVSAQSN